MPDLYWLAPLLGSLTVSGVLLGVGFGLGCAYERTRTPRVGWTQRSHVRLIEGDDRG